MYPSCTFILYPFKLVYPVYDPSSFSPFRLDMHWNDVYIPVKLNRSRLPVVDVAERHDSRQLGVFAPFLLRRPPIDPRLHLVPRVGRVHVDSRDDTRVVKRQAEACQPGAASKVSSISSSSFRILRLWRTAHSKKLECSEYGTPKAMVNGVESRCGSASETGSIIARLRRVPEADSQRPAGENLRCCSICKIFAMDGSLSFDSDR